MSEGPSLESFGQQLLQAAGRADLSALVLDLRFNTGGNGNLAASLMKGLDEKLKSTPVFVITGRATFSAGVLHTAQWKEWGATIVGEPVGDELDWWAEGGSIELPNSKLTLHYSNGFHGYSKRATQNVDRISWTSTSIHLRRTSWRNRLSPNTWPGAIRHWR